MVFLNTCLPIVGLENCLIAPCFQVTLLGVVVMIDPIPLSLRILMDLFLGSPVSEFVSISLKRSSSWIERNR